LGNLSKKKILASSSGWVASLLNFLPGVGAGYIYQRRWLPYFLTLGAVTGWLVLGIVLQGNKEPNQTDQLIGIAGLFVISLITLVEANLAFNKAVKITNIEEEKTNSLPKKGWFK